jgi:hypothetical protein
MPFILLVAGPNGAGKTTAAQLKRVGCDPGAIDGEWGPNARDALTKFARHAKIELRSDAPSEDALERLRSHKGSVCPPQGDRQAQLKDAQKATKPRARQEGGPRHNAPEATVSKGLCWNSPGGAAVSVRPCP